MNQLRYFVRNCAFSSQVFDRKCKLWQKTYAAKRDDKHLYTYLKDEVAYRLNDQISDIDRTFDNVLNLNCDRGQILKEVNPKIKKNLILTDCIQENLDEIVIPENCKINVTKKLMDDEYFTFNENSLDLIISNLSLHWINNLPNVLSQCLKSLKEDGVFLASIFGGDTLYELRCSLQLAEMERLSGLSCHISPFTKIQDIAGLLQQAGFVMVTIALDEIIIQYPTMWELMWDLQRMGENNAAIYRSTHLHKDVQFAAAAIYEELYGSDNKIPATFQIINMIGWKPSKTQPKPLERGSAQVSLKDLTQNTNHT